MLTKLTYFMIESQELINKLRMCRNDLNENIIVSEIQRIASSSINSPLDVLRGCIRLAMEGRLMPWEIISE